MPFASSIPIDTTGWDAGRYLLKVVAKTVQGWESYPLFASIYVAPAQPLPPAPPNPSFGTELVSKLLDVEGPSVVPSNALFSGRMQSSGDFSGGEVSGLDIGSGIVLTTGDAILWNGGDDGYQAEDTGESLYAQGDFFLDGLVTGIYTDDAAVLEFDANCQHGQLELEYQFGSDEYDEYLNQHDDAFAVTVDGTLVSLLPDCSGIVAVNSVNNGYDSIPPSNSHLFLDDDEDIGTRSGLIEELQLEYDGVTIPLVLYVFVSPQSDHHIRIVIADVNDESRDSALFVREGSLRTIDPIISQPIP
jgi:hypothetical protein